MAGEWAAQLSDDLKGNELLTSHETLSDFAKAHLESVGKLEELDGRATTLEGEKTDLEGKLANAIPKLEEEPTEEAIAAYREAMGIPATPDEYEFPVTEGVEHDDDMINWAREIFHQAQLNKEQAGAISQAWDTLLLNMQKADAATYESAMAESEKTLKTEWGADFDGNLALTKRAFEFFQAKVPGFKDFLAVENSKGTALGNHPLMVRAFHVIGKAMGEDLTLPVDPKIGEGDAAPGMGYTTMERFKG